MDFSTSVKTLPKVGSKLAASLAKLEIQTVGDLLYHFPYKYLDFSKNTEIINLRTGDTVTISGTLHGMKAVRSFRSRISFSQAKIVDRTGFVEVIWFNQPYLARSYNDEDLVYLAGTVTAKPNGQLQLINPIIEKFSDNSIHTGRIIPVYHSVEVVYNKTLRQLIDYSLQKITDWPETLAQTDLKTYHLLNLKEAIGELHFPTSWENIAQAKLRIACEELLPQQLAVLLKEQQLAKAGSFAMPTDISAVQNFIKSLPFTLTNSQKRAAWDILQDLNQKKPMNRLLQGEVGSGKTVVIAIAALQTALHNNQTAILAPTEILAQQHYQTFKALLKPQNNISLALLTRSKVILDGKLVSKASLLKSIQNNKAHIVIGTHALLQSSTEFSRLALLVIDEQHRFGVAQRSHLKHANLTKPPHLLSVSATPIPRTLALSVYGNLQISDLKQMPSGRKPVITKVVAETDRDKVYHFINQQIEEGRQAFVVTPRVEESDKSELKAVKAEFKQLQTEVFPNLAVGLIYGKMKASEKDKATKAFAEGKIDILVATSVIEIGVDFPNASVMVIEGAERFGLSQLHQLRGRVGRGLAQSYCFLLTTTNEQQSNERLQTFAKTFDGFKLAEADLQQRGFGDLFGSMQSGFNFRFPQFITEQALHLSKDMAENILENEIGFAGYKQLIATARTYSEDYHGE